MIIFSVFEAFSFLAQGKIIIFSVCSLYYLIGIISLFFLYIGLVIGMFVYTRRQMIYYRKIKYEYEYPLDQVKYFSLICVGAFFGGFNGGLFAVGNSTTIIFVLLYLQI